MGALILLTKCHSVHDEAVGNRQHREKRLAQRSEITPVNKASREKQVPNLQTRLFPKNYIVFLNLSYRTLLFLILFIELDVIL
jgi:hypothetical protein